MKRERIVNPKNTRDRILWIDFLKVVGITLVVLGHIPFMVEGGVVGYLYAFHMPLFFFMSGLLAKNLFPKEQWKAGVRSILIPYACFYAISYVIWLGISYRKDPSLFNDGNVVFNVGVKPFLGMIFGNGYHTETSSMVHLALWFVICLFVITLLQSVLNWLVSRKGLWVYPVFVVGTMLGAYVLKSHNIDLYFSLDSALLCFPFYSAAFFLAKRTNYLPFSKTVSLWPKALVSLVVGVLLLGLLWYTFGYNGAIQTNEANFGNNLGLFYFNAFLGIFGMLCLTQVYAFRWNFITVLASGTLIILVFHGWVSKVLLILLGYREGLTESISLDMALLVSAVTVVLHYPLIVFIRKYVPFLNGGR